MDVQTTNRQIGERGYTKVFDEHVGDVLVEPWCLGTAQNAGIVSGR